MQTILVAVDGSEHADRAVAIAADLAMRHKSKLVILHVVQPGALQPEERELARSEHLSGADAAQEAELHAIPLWIREALSATAHTAEDTRIAHRIGEMVLQRAERAARQAGCADVETLHETGDPADAIVACAEHARADAVVLGSRGLGGLSEVLLGSVSHAVAQRLSCTCVMVK